MKNEIMTVAGIFYVWTNSKPSQGDETLLKLTQCINDAILPYISKGKKPEKALAMLDEAVLEKKLFESLRAGGGYAPRLKLTLKNKTIELTRW